MNIFIYSLAGCTSPSQYGPRIKVLHSLIRANIIIPSDTVTCIEIQSVGWDEQEVKIHKKCRSRLMGRLVPPGRVLQKKLGRGVRPASQNPYPIYDQNLRFSLPYLWPEVASSKKKSNPGLECKNLYPNYYQNGGKMAKSDTLFMTKTAEKPYPLAPHITI